MRHTGSWVFLALLFAFPLRSVGADLADSGIGSSCAKQLEFCEDIKRYATLMRLPGLSVAVVRDGRIVYEQREGFADLAQRKPIAKDAIFPIASITKTFTAVLMMQYVEEGKIQLDDYILDYPFIGIKFGWPYNTSSDARIKHFLSHTSEGPSPGDGYVYNGRKFNYVYGVFEKISGQKDNPKAFPQELRKRIIDRLKLVDTLAGVPGEPADPHISRIVTTYQYDRKRGAFAADDAARTYHTAYPATGILTTVADLARYSTALDENALVTKASYQLMTTPFTTNDGSHTPYGLGWFSEEWGGAKLHWAYGQGSSFSSFLLRIPQEKLTLIFFTNTNAMSDSMHFDFGNALQFPVAQSFLRHFSSGHESLPRIDFAGSIGSIEKQIAAAKAEGRRAAFAETVGQAMAYRFAEKMYAQDPGKALSLVIMLHRIDPSYFRSYRPELIALVSDIASKELLEPMSDLADAYVKSQRTVPDVGSDIAKFYERVGQDNIATKYRLSLVEAPGYETYEATVLACFALGDHYFQAGDVKTGRRYYWKGINDAMTAQLDDGFINEKSRRMSDLSRNAGIH